MTILSQMTDAQRSEFGSAIPPVRPRSLGQFSFGSGRIERVTSLDTFGRTWEYIRRCPLPFDAIQVCMSMGQTSTSNAITPKAFVGGAAVPSLADADVTTAGARLFLFSGSNNPNVPPSPAFQRRTYQWSDIMRLSSVPATDGLGGYLLALRAYLAAPTGTGNVITMGDTPGNDAFASWEAHPSRPFRLRSKAGQFTSSDQWMNMSAANSAVASTGPIAMVRLLYRGAVVNTVTLGDSTHDGRGAYLGDGPLSKASALGAPGCVIEHTNLGWSGATAQIIYQNLLDYIAAGGGGDIALVPTFFTNDVSSGAIPATGTQSIDWMRGYRATMEMALQAAGIRSILATSQPANFSVRPWGSSDTRRIAGDDDTRASIAAGRIVFDQAKAVTGPVDGNGQQTIINSNDGIHQNEAGLLLQGPALNAVVRRLVLGSNGFIA